MEITDLIKVGIVKVKKSKNSINSEFLLYLDDDYIEIVKELNIFFLIFKDHRVRYGKIFEQKYYQDNIKYIKFDDEDLHNEIKKENEVYLCLEKELIEKLENDNGYFDPIGFHVIWNNQNVGKITEFFFNGAHDVYEIKMNDENVVLIPDVESFVPETNVKEKYITVVNLDQFF
jgi:ribosomal 30S subunit maturation factor RimM